MYRTVATVKPGSQDLFPAPGPWYPFIRFRAISDLHYQPQIKHRYPRPVPQIEDTQMFQTVPAHTPLALSLGHEPRYSQKQVYAHTSCDITHLVCPLQGGRKNR